MAEIRGPKHYNLEAFRKLEVVELKLRPPKNFIRLCYVGEGSGTV